MDSMLEILNNCLKDSNLETISKADLRKKYLENKGLTKLPKEDKELFTSAVNTAYLNYVSNKTKAVDNVENIVNEETSENEIKENGKEAIDSFSDEDITPANIKEKVLSELSAIEVNDVKMEHSSDSDEMPLSSYKKDVEKSSDKQRGKRMLTSSSEDEIIPNKSTKKSKILKTTRKSSDSETAHIKPEAKKKITKSIKNKNSFKNPKLELSDSEEDEPLSIFQKKSNSCSGSSLNKSDVSEDEDLIKYSKKQSNNAIDSEEEPVMALSKKKSKSFCVSKGNSSDSEDEPISQFKKSNNSINLNGERKKFKTKRRSNRSDESTKSKTDSSDSEDEPLGKFGKFNSSESDDEPILSLAKKKSNVLNESCVSKNSSESENESVAKYSKKINNSTDPDLIKNLSSSEVEPLHKLNNKETFNSRDSLKKPVKKPSKREVKHSLQKLNGDKSKKETSKKSMKRFIDSDEDENDHVSNRKKGKSFAERKNSILSDSSEDEPLTNLSKKETKRFSDSENEPISNIRKKGITVASDSEDEPLSTIRKKRPIVAGDSEEESLANITKEESKNSIESEDECLANIVKNESKISSDSEDEPLASITKTEQKNVSESEDEPLATITKKEPVKFLKEKNTKKKPIANSRKSIDKTLNKRKKKFVDSDDNENTDNETKEKSFEEQNGSFFSDSNEDESLSNVTKMEPKHSSDSENEPLNKFSTKKLEKKQKCSESDSSSFIDENEEHSSKKNKASKKKNVNDSEKGKKRPSASENKIEHLKKYVRVAGIRIQNYNKFFENCKTMKAKYEKLLSLLEKEGLKGRPTLEKCKKLKMKIETKREIAELDLSNILKEEGGRPKRTVCSDTTNCKSEVENSTPIKKFSRLKDIIDSEESD